MQVTAHTSAWLVITLVSIVNTAAGWQGVWQESTWQRYVDGGVLPSTAADLCELASSRIGALLVCAHKQDV